MNQSQEKILRNLRRLISLIMLNWISLILFLLKKAEKINWNVEACYWFLSRQTEEAKKFGVEGKRATELLISCVYKNSLVHFNTYRRWWNSNRSMNLFFGKRHYQFNIRIRPCNSASLILNVTSVNNKKTHRERIKKSLLVVYEGIKEHTNVWFMSAERV